VQYFSGLLPSTYKTTRNELDGFNNTTKFSSWLAFGCISARQVFNAVNEYEHQHIANESTYWIKFELLWREYFKWHALNAGKQLFIFKGQKKTKPLTTFLPARFAMWCQGTTPYPLVNAIMNELNTTGYISNRSRQIAASCLVNELQLDWRYGAAYFEQQLIDYDVASNWGNWQYIAGVGVDPRGGRHFNIEKQTQQHDPHGVYTHKWHGNDNICTQLDSLDAVDWPV
jgi:deoxyribodipyrimidine photo-lyase